MTAETEERKMDEIRVEIEREGAVRKITIARPDKRNALSRAMFTELKTD